MMVLPDLKAGSEWEGQCKLFQVILSAGGFSAQFIQPFTF